MTDSEYVLDQLERHANGRDAMQIISASIRDRGVGLTVHSRVADLRRQGWEITCAIEGKNRRGFPRYVYRLQGRAASQQCSPSVERAPLSSTPAAPLDAPIPGQLEMAL